jgi:hypothetical protein
VAIKRFTLDQLEQAIGYWHQYHRRAMVHHHSADGARQVQLLTALCERMDEQHLLSIAIDQMTSTEFAALGCLYGVPPALD